MPIAPKRVCLQSGCNVLVERGRCGRHTRAHHRRDALARGTARQRGYGGPWRRIRRRHLKAEPLCRHCAEAGRTTGATLVDHIVPLDVGGTHEASNLQSLCRSCHGRKTLAEHPRTVRA